MLGTSRKSTLGVKKNTTRTGIEKYLNDTETTGNKGAKGSKGAPEQTLFKAEVGTKSKNVSDCDCDSVKRKRNLKSKEKEEDLWDKLVKAGKRNRSSIADEAIERAKNETKEEEEDPYLEELEADVTRLTETDWSEAINFLQMEQFSSRQETKLSQTLFLLPRTCACRDIDVMERLQEVIKKGESEFEALVKQEGLLLDIAKWWYLIRVGELGVN